MITGVEYTTRKAAGTMTLAKIGSSYATETKKFDPSTGAALSPDIAAIGMDQVEAAITTVTLELAALNTLKADMEALG